jgi:glycerophosphoryl diester phosphodiesterase
MGPSSSKSLPRRPALAFAHRGGEKLWPSNTLYAYQRALALGVNALEMDIHASADGALVVRHDPVVETTTDGHGAIAELTLAQIQALDAGYTWTADGGYTFPYRGLGITIPTVEQVFQAFPHTRLNFDIKPQAPEVTGRFSRLLKAYGYDRSGLAMVASFHDAQLRRFRRLCPGAPTAAGVTETRMFYLLQRAGLARLYRPQAQAFQIRNTPGASAWSRRVLSPPLMPMALKYMSGRSMRSPTCADCLIGAWMG